MRVMLIAGCFPPTPCGVGDYAEKLANALNTHEHVQIGVLTKITAKTGTSHFTRYDLFDVISGWTLSECQRIITVIKNYKPDIVHIQYPSQAFYGRPVALFLPILLRVLGNKVVLTWHEPYGYRKTVLFFLLLLGAHGLIFVRPNFLKLSPRFFESILSKYKNTIIPNASAIPASQLCPTEREKLRAECLGKQKRLIAFFGFVYPKKGIEHLFEIADPETDMLIIIGATPNQEYVAKLTATAVTKGWTDQQVRFTGYADSERTANLLFSADAVVLPFLDGGGDWNTSIHSAVTQGTLVITTSLNALGYDENTNVYNSRPFDISGMRNALNELSGRRINQQHSDSNWQNIARKHSSFYAYFYPKR